MKQYKILTQKDSIFSGKFNPEALETALNTYAAEGWRLVTATTADIPVPFAGSDSAPSPAPWPPWRRRRRQRPAGR